MGISTSCSAELPYRLTRLDSLSHQWQALPVVAAVSNVIANTAVPNGGKS